LVLTRRETIRLERNYIGTEHILLGLIDEPQGVAMRTLSRFGVDPDEVLPEVTGMIGGRRTERRSASRPEDSMYARALRDSLVRAPVEGLMIHARCVVTDEERALPQALRVDLEYTYRAAEGDKMDATVDYGAVLQDAAELLERKGFRLLETGASRVGAHVVEGFSEIWEVTVRVTKLHVPEPRAGSGVSVEARFRR
jgi:dihydroneopterin aldolase